MKVVFEDVSIETLFIVEICLESRRSELCKIVHNLRSEFKKLVDAHDVDSSEFVELKDALEECENEEDLLLGFLKQL